MQAGHGGLRPRRAMLALAVVGCAVLFGAGSPAHAGGGATTTLPNDVVHNLGLATLTGAVPATQTVTVGVFLANPNQAAEDAYAKQLYDPSSPNYGNYLDPGTFNSEFGVPAATFQAAQSWLQADGLTVTSVEGATDYMLASGSAAQIETVFGTPLNTYIANGRSFYANTLAPTVPASLGISDVLGLNNFNKLFTPRVWATGATTTSAVPTSGNVPKTGLLSIRDLWSIYDAPSTNLGNGQTMAIFGWGVTDPVIPDLRSFEAEWGLPGVPISVKKYGSTATPDTSGDGATGEWELDTQASTGMAPNVKSETLYFARHNDETESLAAFTGWVNDKNGPLQGSASFGECENVGNAGAILTDGMEVPGDKILEQGVIEGRTLFSSTGDTGSSCPIAPVDTNGLATQGYPGTRVALGEPVGRRGWRHGPDGRRQHAGAPPHGDRLGVHGRRQLDERTGRQLPAGRRLDELPLRPERESLRAGRRRGRPGLPLDARRGRRSPATPSPATASRSTATTARTRRERGRASRHRSGSASGLASRPQPRARGWASRTTRSTSSRSRRAAGTSTTSRSATTSRIRPSPATTTPRAGGHPRPRRSCRTSRAGSRRRTTTSRLR